jgi:hypothetical protein
MPVQLEGRNPFHIMSLSSNITQHLVKVIGGFSVSRKSVSPVPLSLSFKDHHPRLAYSCLVIHLTAFLQFLPELIVVVVLCPIP